MAQKVHFSWYDSRRATVRVASEALAPMNETPNGVVEDFKAKPGQKHFGEIMIFLK